MPRTEMLNLLQKFMPPQDETCKPRPALAPLKQLPSPSKNDSSAASTLKPLPRKNQRAAAALSHQAKDRAAHPLPEMLKNLDPYATPNIEGPARPKSPMLRRKKSDPTLQLHRASATAEMATPVKDSETQRKAREKWRYMLGGSQAGLPKYAPGSETAAIVASAARVDEQFLKRCNQATLGLNQAQRTEVEHIARYGLTDKTRQWAKTILEQHDPFLRFLGQKVVNPALMRAPVPQVCRPQAAGKNHTPSIRMIQRKQPLTPNSAAKIAVAEVMSDSGQNYLVAEPSNGGSFKRFSVGLKSDGTPIGVLLMRGPKSRDIFGDAIGKDLSLAAIAEEIENLSAYSDAFEIYDAFPVHGVWYVMVPLFDAGNLDEVFARLKPKDRYGVAINLLPSLLKQILDMPRLHRALHRDIKTENVFCKSSGEAVIADFGMAAKLDPNGALNDGFGGTFFAPEQILNQRVTPAMDLYSLGASIGDLFVRRSSDPNKPYNPHVPTFDRSGNYDNGAQQLHLNKFNAYRKILFDEANEGLFNPNCIQRVQVSKDADEDLWNIAAYHSEFDRAAPMLARFVIEHLLEPNPAFRSYEDGQVLIELANLMAAAYNATQNSPAQRRLPVDRGIEQNIEALKEVHHGINQRAAKVA